MSLVLLLSGVTGALVACDWLRVALVKNFTDVAASQFGTAAPAVIAAAAGLAVIMWGVPKLIGFFKRTAK